MKSYRFSMEKVLEWRADLEDSAHLLVKEKEEALQNEQARLEGLIKESRKLKSENLFKSSIDDLKRHSLYTELLDDKIVRQKLAIQTAETELDRAREQLKEAHKDKKVMEKLEEKEKKRYIEFVNKKEQEQLDEISTLSFGRPTVY
ncbi:hypothetical protein GCM10008932_13430 [Alkalibacterium iburiense]|uniref:Flagellar FliJ protein n=1 Tax=Alkalibacterium iburiense TaxID=290589 RepID=A0ABP3H8P7_9LACT